MAPASTTVAEIAPKISTVAPTLAGTSNPSAPPRARRAPLLFGLVLLAAVAAGAGLVTRAAKAPGATPPRPAALVTAAPAAEVGVAERIPLPGPEPIRSAAPPATTTSAPSEAPPRVTVGEPHEDAGSPPFASAWPRKAPFGHPWGKGPTTPKLGGSPDNEPTPPPPRKKDDIGF
jgi:hypothetical protein